MKRRGELMGEEAMYLGMAQVWMPGSNIHRTPFGGRNFEYFSEDAVMTYLCSAPEIEGMASRGVHAGPKHFVGNEQENDRSGLAQAGAKTAMHGFNRLGLDWCSTSSALLGGVAEQEWGFVGQQETDAVASAESGYKGDYLSALVAGTDTFCLDFSGVSGRTIQQSIEDNDDGFLLSALRQSAHNYLYTVTNSSVMTGYTTESKVVAVTPWWIPLGYGVLTLLGVLFAACLWGLYREGKKHSVKEQAGGCENE